MYICTHSVTYFTNIVNDFAQKGASCQNLARKLLKYKQTGETLKTFHPFITSFIGVLSFVHGG